LRQNLSNFLSYERARGLHTPIRVGIPGPAGIQALLRFATHCSGGVSTAVMKKYGVSITNLLRSGGSDVLVSGMAQKLGPLHGEVNLHFYPFGGLVKTVEWINDYQRKRLAGAPAK
jgi:methylenetetrahydrofolate reductase (NADPH)